MTTNDELAYVKAERDHFAQFARDTFQKLKAVTAERDRYAIQLRDALPLVGHRWSLASDGAISCTRCGTSWTAPVSKCPTCCCGPGEGCSSPNCTGTPAAGVGASEPVEDNATESRSSGLRDGHLDETEGGRVAACTCGRVWEGHPNPHAITCPKHISPHLKDE